MWGCAERAGAKLGFYEEQDWWCGSGVCGRTGTILAGGTEEGWDLSTLLLCQARPLLSIHQVTTGQLVCAPAWGAFEVAACGKAARVVRVLGWEAGTPRPETGSATN